jgi:hypothetical protein
MRNQCHSNLDRREWQAQRLGVFVFIPLLQGSISKDIVRCSFSFYPLVPICDDACELCAMCGCDDHLVGRCFVRMQHAIAA